MEENKGSFEKKDFQKVIDIMNKDTEEKYYKPIIDEFHVGFEYEYWQPPLRHAHPNSGRWVQDTVWGGEDNWSDIHRGLQEGSTYPIRVKYLDEQDLEELGLSRKGETSQYVIYLESDKKWIFLSYRGTFKPISIYYAFNQNPGMLVHYIVSDIRILNKSELKKLMDQLSIPYKK